MRSYWSYVLASTLPGVTLFGSTLAARWILGPSPRMTLVSSVGARH